MTMDVSESKLADGFTAGAFQSVLPMVIWAAHFFVSYVSCRSGMRTRFESLRSIRSSGPECLVMDDQRGGDCDALGVDSASSSTR